MSLYLRGNIWWSRIEVDGSVHQFSTGMRSKHQARSVEAAKRTDLVKGLAGLSAPTLNDFSARFINSLPGRVSRQTYSFYIRHWIPLVEFPGLSECRLDRINPAVVQDFISWRRKQENGRGGTISVVTVNHNLRTLRRALHLAVEWNVIAKVPKIKLLPGEHQREYVLSDDAIQKFEKEEGLIGKIERVRAAVKTSNVIIGLLGDSSEGDQCSSVKAISSFAIPIRSRSAATLVGGLCRK